VGSFNLFISTLAKGRSPERAALLQSGELLLSRSRYASTLLPDIRNWNWLPTVRPWAADPAGRGIGDLPGVGTG
jgi:hypothetical protein